MKRTIITILIIAVLGVGGYFGYQYYQQYKSAQSPAYQTQPLKRGQITALVGATGTVRTNQTTYLSWQTTGRIGKIDVKVGDAVHVGDVLAELRDDSLPQTLIQARSDLVTARRNLSNLQDSRVAMAQAEVNLANARKALDDALKKRTQKNYRRASQATIDAANANYILANQAVKDAEEAYAFVIHRAEDDPDRAALLNVLANARQNRDRALANLDWVLGKPDAVEIAQADAQVALAEANLKDAQREWDRLKDGADPDDLAAAEARLEAIQSAIKLTRLEAPFDGSITDMNSMEGDQVSPGTVSFRLDDVSHLLIDVEVTEVDINRIRVGQMASLTFDAISGKTYNGRVTEVSRVGSTVQGVVNFTVTIELLDADQDVLPGMTSAVNVVVQQVNDALIVPNRAVLSREGKRVVYVLRQNKPTLVEVTIGAISDNNSQVLAGDVKEGDLVLINLPIELRFSNQPQ